jgi:membrane protease subunit (stomatin/prohibitin family)
MSIIDVLEYSDPTGKEMIHRMPENGSANIKVGSQLVVQETQSAIFFRDGKAEAVFGPGRHTLTTNNLPFLSGLIEKHITDGKTPFSAVVFFVNQKEFTNLLWGTQTPIPLQDEQLGPIELKGRGSYSVRIDDPKLFVTTIVGTQGFYRQDELDKFFKEIILTGLTTLISKTFKGYFELQKTLDDLAGAMKIRLKEDFESYGIELRKFNIAALTGDEESIKDSLKAMRETAQSLQQRKQMENLGVNYVQKGSVDALKEMAKHDGGGNAGMQLGAGLGMGLMMPGVIQQGMQQPLAAPIQQPGGPTVAMMACPKCHAQAPATSKFCPGCGNQMGFVTCANCGQSVPGGGKFCSSCGKPLAAPAAAKCANPECGADLQPGAKFCLNCGKPVE